MANWFEDLLIELRYKLIKRFAQECCANCRYQNKTRGNLDYFVLTPGDATQVRGRVYDWLQPLEISLPGGRKVPYMMPIKYHSIPPLVIKIQPAGPTDEPEPAYDYGYTPKKSNSQEYVEGQLQHFLIKPGTQGQKKPKGALGLGPY